jgi:hypothetical protein
MSPIRSSVATLAVAGVGSGSASFTISSRCLARLLGAILGGTEAGATGLGGGGCRIGAVGAGKRGSGSAGLLTDGEGVGAATLCPNLFQGGEKTWFEAAEVCFGGVGCTGLAGATGACLGVAGCGGGC